MNRSRVLLIALVTLAASAGGCVSSNAGNVYSRSEVGRAAEVRQGTIQSLRTVRIEGTGSPVGTTAGALLGGIAGSSVGGGTGRRAATVVGAVGGGMAGAAAEELATRSDGIEFIIQLDNGRTLAVVQEPDGTPWQIGQRVRVLEIGGRYRVSL